MSVPSVTLTKKNKTSVLKSQELPDIPDTELPDTSDTADTELLDIPDNGDSPSFPF
ncbi:unnamed protein product, partial [marine sediment metagenome]